MSDRERTARNISLVGVGIIIISMIIFLLQVIIFNFYKSYLEDYYILNVCYIVSLFISIILLMVGLITFIIFRADKIKPRENVIKILYERYAKGEITKKEFEDMKKDLEG
jgi:putative membrane protein